MSNPIISLNHIDVTFYQKSVQLQPSKTFLSQSIVGMFMA